MNEITYLVVISAAQFAKWLWPTVQPGIASVSEKLGEEVARVLIPKIKGLFGERATALDKLPVEQLDDVVQEAVTILPTLNYTDENLLREIQLALNKLLQSSNNYTLNDIHMLYTKFVNPNTPLAELIMRFPFSPQTGIAQEIVQNATVRRRLPELIQDMRASIHP